MRKYTWTALAIAVGAGALVLSAVAFAGGAPESAALTGAQEVPAADPDGSGTASLTLNPGQGEICFELSVSGIAPATASHIHRAPAGVAGPVVVPLTPPTSGTSSGCVTVDRELVLDIL